jgi:hypothetical protein
MSLPQKKAPRLGPGRERQNSVRTICEQSYGGKPLISLAESKFTGIAGDCITIAILSAKLSVTREARLAQRIRSLIRKMTRNFNRVCFDLQRGART